MQDSATKHHLLMCATSASVKHSKNNDVLKSASAILYSYTTNKVPRSMNSVICVCN